MADPYQFDDEFLNEVAAYRRERNKELRKKIAANIGAAAEGIRTGESAPSVRARWMPDYSDQTMTAQQKVAARQKVGQDLAGIEKYRLAEARQQASDYLDALKAELRAATDIMQAQSGESKSRASAEVQAVKGLLNVADDRLYRARDPDGRADRLLQAARRRFQGETKAKYGQQAEQLQAMPADQLVQHLSRLNPGAPEQQIMDQARMIKAADPDDLAAAMASENEQEIPADLTERMVEEAFKPGTPAAQSVHLLGEFATMVGEDPRKLAERVDPAYASAYDKAEVAQFEEMKNIGEVMQNAAERLARAPGMVGSNKRRVQEMQDRIAQYRQQMAQAVDVMAPRTKVVRDLERTTQEAREMAGAVPQAGAPAGDDDPQVAYKRILDESDPVVQAHRTLEYIEKFPESSPAQEMKKAITGSEKYQAWKRSRGYDGYDDKLVFKEFRKETRAKDKERKRRFKKQVELNRAQGLGPAPKDTGSSTVVAGVVSPTRSEEDPREPR